MNDHLKTVEINITLKVKPDDNPGDWLADAIDRCLDVNNGEKLVAIGCQERKGEE
jgi:hypothetical protein